MEAAQRQHRENAAPEMTPRQRRHALRFAVAGQCFGVPLWHCVITGGLMTLLALSPSLRASDLAIGLINAGLFLGVSALAVFPVLPRENARWMMVVFWMLSGLAALPLLAVPELARSAGRGAALTMIAVSGTLYAAFYAAGAAGWTPILHTLLPRRVARRFLGVLRMAWQLVSFLAMIVVAVVVGGEGAAQRYRFVLALFLTAHFVRLLFVGFIPQQITKDLEAVKRAPLLDLVKDRPYRRFSAYCALTSFLTALSVPSMYVYLVRGVGFGHNEVALVGAVGLLGGLSTFPLWGRLGERRGVGAVYQGAIFTAVIGLGAWLVPVIVEPDPAMREGGIMLFALASAIFFALRSAQAGLSLAFARHAFRLRPQRPEATSRPLAPAAQWGGTALGVLAGGAFVTLAGPAQTALGLRTYQWLFLANSVLLLIPLAIAAEQKVPESSSAA